MHTHFWSVFPESRIHCPTPRQLFFFTAPEICSIFQYQIRSTWDPGKNNWRAPPPPPPPQKKIARILPEICPKFARNLPEFRYIGIFFWGGGTLLPCPPPVSYAYCYSSQDWFLCFISASPIVTYLLIIPLEWQVQYSGSESELIFKLVFEMKWKLVVLQYYKVFNNLICSLQYYSWNFFIIV